MGLVTRLRDGKAYLDANVFIYALEGYEAFRDELTKLFHAIERGELEAVTSELTLAELLVKPFRQGDVSGELRCREIVQSRGGLSVTSVNSRVLVESARVRAATNLRMPDAIHVASAVTAGCKRFVTNDQRLRKTEGLEIVLLSEHAGA